VVNADRAAELASASCDDRGCWRRPRRRKDKRRSRLIAAADGDARAQRTEPDHEGTCS